MRKYKNYIGLFYILAVFFVVPIYNKGTFDNLSQNKVEAFYFVSGSALVLYFLISVIFDIREKNKAAGKAKPSFGLFDISLVSFFCANFLSLIFSGNIKNAFYGVPGFGMGLLSVMIMVISSYFISKNVSITEPIIHMMAVSSVFPVILAILNRLGVDPLNMFENGEAAKYHLYVSTLGNYSAFSSYMSIVILIICYMAFFSRNIKVKICYVTLLIIDVISIILAGTTAVKLITLMVILIAFIRRFKLQIRIKSSTAVLIFATAILVYIGLIFYGTLNPDFGNGRGFIWKLSLEMFKSFSLRQKIFGAGPNCYMYALTDFLLTNETYLAACNERFGNLALTSAHSEYLDYLINSGIIGILSYLFLLATAIKTYFDREEKDSVTGLAFLCVLSYLVLVTVNFSSVLATPYFFIFLGALQKNE